jgi:hypothetical protein
MGWLEKGWLDRKYYTKYIQYLRKLFFVFNTLQKSLKIDSFFNSSLIYK